MKPKYQPETVEQNSTILTVSLLPKTDHLAGKKSYFWSSIT